MPNDNDLCANCGQKLMDHRFYDLACPMYSDNTGEYDETTCYNKLTDDTVSVPASLLDKVRALCVEADNYDLMLCYCCKRLNPQHKDCTSCSDRDNLIKSLTAVREALAEIDKEE